MKTRARRIGLAVIASLFLASIFGFVAINPNKLANAEAVIGYSDFGVTWSTNLKDYSSAGVTPANVSVSYDTTNTSGQSLYGFHVNSDMTYNDTYTVRDDYIPYNQALTMSVDRLIDTDNTVEFYMSPTIAGYQSGAVDGQRFIMALSDDMNAQVKWKDGFSDSSAIVLEFYRGDQYKSSHDARAAGQNPYLNGTQTSGGDLRWALYGRGYFVKVSMTFDDTNLYVSISAVDPANLSAEKDKCNFTYPLANYGLAKDSQMKLYFGYYSKNAANGDYIAQGYNGYKDGGSEYYQRRIPVAFDLYNYKNGDAVTDAGYVVKASVSGNAGTLGENGKAGSAAMIPINGNGLYGYKVKGTAYYYGWDSEIAYDYSVNMNKPVSFLLEPNYESSGNGSGVYNESTLCRKVHIELVGESGAIAWNLFAPWAGGSPDRIRFSGTGVASNADTSTGTNYVKAFYAANNSDYYLKITVVPNGTSSKLVFSAVNKTTLAEDTAKYEHTFAMPTFTGDVSLSVSYFTGYNDTAISSVPEREKVTNLNFGIYNFRNGDVKTLLATNLEGDAGDTFNLSESVSYTLFDGQTAPNVTYASSDDNVATVTNGVLTVANGNTDASATVTVTAGDVSTTFTVARTHLWDGGIQKTAATCSAAGVTTYTCSGCGATKDVTEGNADPNAHEYVFSSFVWEGYTANAVYVCSHNAEHTDIKPATVTSAVTTAPSQEAQGEITYTATEGSNSDHKTKAINLAILSRSITVGTDLTFNVYAGVYGTDKPTMRFVMEDSEIDVEKSGELKDGEFLFTFKVAPQNIGKDVTITLNGAEDETVSITTSVKDYLEKIFAITDNDELKELIARTLAYGNAAIVYRTGETGDLLSAETASFIGEDYTPVSALERTETTVEGVYFNSAKVVFASTNKIAVYFRAADVEGLTVEIDGKETSFVRAGEGVYEVLTPDIYAYEMDEVHTFVIKVNGTAVQTLSYSLASYVYTVINGNFDAEYKTLAQALYNYGKAALNYIG